MNDKMPAIPLSEMFVHLIAKEGMPPDFFLFWELDENAELWGHTVFGVYAIGTFDILGNFHVHEIPRKRGSNE